MAPPSGQQANAEPGLGMFLQHLALLSLHICPSVMMTPAGQVDSKPFVCLTLALSAGMGKKDDPKLMQEWFRLVQEKNAMVRYESELMIL